MNEVMKYLPEPEQGVVRWDVKARFHGYRVDYSRICGLQLLQDLLDLKQSTAQ